MTDRPTKWRVVLEYDGAPFSGWQLQPGQRTVQGEIEAALAPLLGHEVRIGGAGRTDAGVHAAMQVACFTTTTDRTPRAIRDGLNARLPPEIACISADAVDEGFDPRHSPHTKTYCYTWLVGATRRPLRRARAWRVRPPLDMGPMREASLCLMGTHDFSSFRAAGCTARHPVRTVEGVRVAARGDEIRLRVLGTGFLRHMVRIIAGSLYDVGRGQRDPAWLAEVLEARSRAAAGRTAPAEGLLLESIRYHEGPNDAGT